MNMKKEHPQVGDMVMLTKPVIRDITDEPSAVKRRGRPPKKAKVVTQTDWVDDVEAIVMSGPTQGISSDGEDYWLEWVTMRLDNSNRQVISTGSRWSGSNWRILNRANSNV